MQQLHLRETERSKPIYIYIFEQIPKLVRSENGGTRQHVQLWSVCSAILVWCYLFFE